MNSGSQLVVATFPFCLVVMLAAGCAAPRADRFVPPKIVVETRHSESLFVFVTTNSVTAPYDASSPGPSTAPPSVDLQFVEMFRSAIVRSMRDCGLYRIADHGDTSERSLEVTILRADGAAQSIGVAQDPGRVVPSGSALLVTRWCLREGQSDVVICQKDITTSGAHDAPDYPWGGMFTMQRNAIEESAAANIRQGIEWLARRTKDN